ncbi:MAG: phosphoglycerate dehydrogenase [Bosea sp.]|uniref:2-hydroxyacid dehydrogenase n=1 Tax=unclassified Bosea (in: a-proteobacteria) TaxID=2653178 RepID=UPI00095FB258|nr:MULTISPECIES: 2-hydroxyacid dehydrogenase [unclassified Bosea (in: a-proteobacteria)]MBN9457971.1 phosphoglycerate dehydrogenase [Bosea sp. (in: a-proteobacteria)]OJV10494.1 MAG: phosphoglycerate dehydrogenase [Bosea sp. 67-29]
MRIIFHGENAASFSQGFAELLGPGAEIRMLPDVLASDEHRAAYAQAEAIIGVKFDASLPTPAGLRLFHVPGAGYDAVDLELLPASAAVCNCFGHEQAIAEYVMSALLARAIPLADADRRLRQGDWAWWAGAPERVHDEIAGRTIGLLGFGHIGKAIAARAKAFEMQVHVANRSPVATSPLVDRAFTLDQLAAFLGSVDVVVVSVPLTEETKGIVGAAAFAAMRPDAVLVNVGRGPTVDEEALYEALRSRRIGGAIIDTWYRYPQAGDAAPLPSKLPFQDLSNVLMTPHMSGWTNGTIRRRQAVIAGNIRRRFSGEPLENVVRKGN